MGNKRKWEWNKRMEWFGEIGRWEKRRGRKEKGGKNAMSEMEGKLNRKEIE
jgi:hypothetical protein